MIFLYSAFAALVQLISKTLSNSLAFNYQNQYKSASKTRRNLASWIANAKSFPRRFRAPKKASKNAPRGPQDAAKGVPSGLKNQDDTPRQLSDESQTTQSASKTSQDGSKTPEDAFKRLLRCPKAPQDASTSTVNLFKSVYHMAAKMFFQRTLPRNLQSSESIDLDRVESSNANQVLNSLIAVGALA